MPEAARSVSDDEGLATVKFVTFQLDNAYYAVNASSVNEVLRHTEITPVPGAPACVLGIINLRGDVLTVIDTREVFGLSPRQIDTQSRIVVVDMEEFAVGVLVDRVAEVVDLHEEAMEPPPNTGDAQTTRFIKGVYRHHEELLVLVNFEAVAAL